ncbi:hepatocyte cell adhesion molecule-like [Morone saxatilis]|uniref:hepatocyte cell adhesion molecule-like n=1 Tax=Morone saxatilis TaxID=34816 RepID=UPI0015E2182E|nr:hepatocyte cell adhesion molecule-like [Morone saxatilis]
MLAFNMDLQFRRKQLTVYFTIVLLGCVWADEEKEAVKAREGAFVTLKTGETTRHSNAQVVWTFGPEEPNVRIAYAKEREVKDDYDEHFRDRLQLDEQTGSLTITQLRINDSGVYMFQSISNNILSQRFHLKVYSSVSSPSIKLIESLINTSCSSVTVECLVENSRELALSWYKGKDRLNKTTSPDLSSTLSVALEIKYHGDDYKCVAENPLEENVTKFHTEDTCLKDGDSSGCESEATVRLVISAVVSIALIVLVVDHIRLRR